MCWWPHSVAWGRFYPVGTYATCVTVCSYKGTAFEFLDQEGMACVNGIGVANPLSTETPFYVLLETHGSSQEHDMAKLEVGTCSYTRAWGRH